jgi:hypothetical protein
MNLRCKIVAFQGEDHVLHNKMYIYNNPTEQVNCFKCLGYYIAYENHKKSVKILNYNTAMGTKDRAFTPNSVQMHTVN